MKAGGTHAATAHPTTGIGEIELRPGHPTAHRLRSPSRARLGQQGIWVVDANGQDRKQADDRRRHASRVVPRRQRDRVPALATSSTHIDSVRAVPVRGRDADRPQQTIRSRTPRARLVSGRQLDPLAQRPGADERSQLDLWVTERGRHRRRAVTNTPSRDERDPAWSPDGRHIVYSGSGAFHGASSSQLYVSHANGSDRRKLTHACGECAWINDDPSWQRLPG